MVALKALISWWNPLWRDPPRCTHHGHCFALIRHMRSWFASRLVLAVALLALPALRASAQTRPSACPKPNAPPQPLLLLDFTPRDRVEAALDANEALRVQHYEYPFLLIDKSPKPTMSTEGRGKVAAAQKKTADDLIDIMRDSAVPQETKEKIANTLLAKGINAPSDRDVSAEFQRHFEDSQKKKAERDEDLRRNPFAFPPRNKPDDGIDKTLWGMIDANHAGEALRSEVLRTAANSADPKLRDTALRMAAPRSPFDDQKLHDVFGRKLEERIVKSLQTNPDITKGQDPTLLRLGHILRANELAKEHPELVANIDRRGLDLGMKSIMADPHFNDILAGIHQSAVREVKASLDYQNHIRMLESDDFLQRLRLEGDGASKTVQTELGKIALIDPKKAVQLSDRFAGTVLANGFFGMNEKDQELALAQAIDAHLRALGDAHAATFTERVKLGKMAPDLLKRVAAVMKSINGRQIAQTAGTAANELDAAEMVKDLKKAVSGASAADQSALMKVLHAAEASDRRGAVSALAATAGLVALVPDILSGKAMADNKAIAASLATIAKSAGSADAFVEFGRMLQGLEKLDKASRLAGTLRVVKILGPAGDWVGFYLDRQKGLALLEKGNMKEGWTTVGEAGSLGVAAAGGTGIVIAGIVGGGAATGPFMPAVVLVGTAGYFTFKGIKYAISDTDEVAFLKENGMWREPSYTERHFVDLWRYEHKNVYPSEAELKSLGTPEGRAWYDAASKREDDRTPTADYSMLPL